MAAEKTWRKVQELRSYNARLRQELAADLAPSPALLQETRSASHWPRGSWADRTP